MNFSIKILGLILGVSAAACGPSPVGPTPLPPIAAPAPPGSPPEALPLPVPVPRTSRTRYLAFGDSLTAGTTSPSATLWRPFNSGLPQSYPFKLQALLAARYRDQTIEVFNEGKPGEAAADAVVRFPGVLRAVTPEVVILLHGVNDVSFLGLPGVRRTADYLNTMAREARLKGSEVMLCTLLPQRPSGFRATDPAVLDAYNAAVREIARGEGAVLVDFAAPGFDLQLIGVDGLHPTEAGYARMAEILFSHARAQYEKGS